MGIIKKILVTSLLSIACLSHASTGCLDDAESHLAYIANYDLGEGFDVSSYDLTITPGDFVVEPSLVYSFSRSIMDSWEIELTSSDCFPVRIEFVGDL